MQTTGRRTRNDGRRGGVAGVPATTDGYSYGLQSKELKFNFRVGNNNSDLQENWKPFKTELDRVSNRMMAKHVLDGNAREDRIHVDRIHVAGERLFLCNTKINVSIPELGFIEGVEL